MKRLSLISLLFILVAAACAPKLQSTNDEALYLEAEPAPGLAAAPPVVESQAAAARSAVPQVAEAQRMVIRNADLTLVVTDPRATLTAIQRLAEEMGGYVTASDLYLSTSENGRRVPVGSITFRVPAERLDEALQQIKEQAVEVRAENIRGQDITAEYIDLESRLRSLEAAEAQLEEMMTQATDMQDVITIFDQLTYYREQIEQVKGQMQYYEQAVALSAVSVKLLAEEGVLPLELGGWDLGFTARQSLQDLIYFVQGFLRFALRLIILYLPAGLLLFLLFYALWRSLLRPFWRRIRPRKRSQS